MEEGNKSYWEKAEISFSFSSQGGNCDKIEMNLSSFQGEERTTSNFCRKCSITCFERVEIHDSQIICRDSLHVRNTERPVTWLYLFIFSIPWNTSSSDSLNFPADSYLIIISNEKGKTLTADFCITVVLHSSFLHPDQSPESLESFPPFYAFLQTTFGIVWQQTSYRKVKSA